MTIFDKYIKKRREADNILKYYRDKFKEVIRKHIDDIRNIKEVKNAKLYSDKNRVWLSVNADDSYILELLNKKEYPFMRISSINARINDVYKIKLPNTYKVMKVNKTEEEIEKSLKRLVNKLLNNTYQI